MVWTDIFFGTDLVPFKGKSNFELVRKDIRELEPADFKGVDCVIDLAGLSNDPSCDLDTKLTKSVNYNGGMNAAKAAKEAGVTQYLYSSSCSVYGTGTTEQLNEESELAPVSEYAKAKINMEKGLLKLADDDFCVTLLRNATVYGLSPRMRFDLVINVMTLHAWNNKRLFIMGGGRQWRPLVHVQDVCRAFYTVFEADREVVQKEAFNVGSTGQNYRVEQIANVIKGVLPETELINVPDDADKRSYNVSFEKINEVLGYEVTKSPVDGIMEIKEALEKGQIDPNDMRTVTIKYYEYLLNAEKVIKEVAVGGKIF